MSEFRKEISLAVAVALVVALGVGYFAITAFPNGPSTTTGVTSGYTTSSTSPPISIPKALLGYLSAQDVSCSLSTGICSFTIVNNSTVPLGLVDCGIQVVVSSNSTVTTWGIVNGTIGGPATTGIPANSRIAAICTAPTSELGLSTVGSSVNGSFTVKLLANWFGYPVGDEPTFNFQGTWS